LHICEINNDVAIGVGGVITIEPLVSVIIPVYNVKPFLAEAMNSIIHQSYRNLEIIIVDDGSTDGSGALCDEYLLKDSRVRIIHQNNQGLSGARNAGLEVATGAYISFMDSDDAFHLEMIQRLMDIMILENADVVMCQSVECRTNGPMSLPNNMVEEQCKFSVYNHDDALRALIDGTLNWYAWNKLYKRECFNDIRFPQGRVYEDVATTFKVLDLVNRVVLLNEPLIMYRRREESITGQYRLRSSLDRNIAYRQVMDFVIEHMGNVFNESHKQRISTLLICGMMETYARYRNDVREYEVSIKQIGKNLDLQKCGLKTAVKYRMFCISPFLFSILLSPFLPKSKRVLE
jgi:glycosyltransferase involved in cell wall biosynthesis